MDKDLGVAAEAAALAGDAPSPLAVSALREPAANASEPFDQQVITDRLEALKVEKFEPFVRDAAEIFYGHVLDTVQDYLRDNLDFNLKSHLSMLERDNANMRRLLREERLVKGELLEACKSAIPAGVCLTNKNIPDDFTVALDCTMGDLRKIAAVRAKATGASA